jgi:hypothetical protein
MKKNTILIGLILVGILSSCGIQFGNYERYKKVHRSSMCSSEMEELEKSVNELRYYVNEDVFNGNLSEEVYEFYTKELYNKEQSIKKINS